MPLTHLLSLPTRRNPLWIGEGDTVMQPINIGRDSISRRPYYIDPTRHIDISGGTGHGKSSLLEHILIDFVRQGHGALFNDPHGDVFDRLTYLLPSSRKRDILLLDPDADSIIPFNPLFFTDPLEQELAKEDSLTVLKAMSGSDSAWGNETPHNARAGLDCICELETNPSFVHLHRWINDNEYRDYLLEKSSNPFLKLWQRQFNKLSLKDQAAKLAPLANKVSKLMRPNILPIIGGGSVDPLKLMNKKCIIICRLSKGRLGDDTAIILYSFITAMFSIAALKREKQKTRTPFLFIADEAQNDRSGRLTTILAEARKYGLSLVTAHQNAARMPMMPDILTNTATQIAFNCSGADAELLAENWKDEKVIPSQITALSRYEFYSRTFEDNKAIVRHINARLPLTPRRESNEALLKISHQYWGVPKAEVMKSIHAFLAH